jgi:hypothetical protein
MLIWRSLLTQMRDPQTAIFMFIQPIMFVLMFRYVFGGAIDTPGARYVDYLMPGIFVQTVAFAGITTAVGLATDLNTGIVDRLRSLPMAPWGRPCGPNDRRHASCRRRARRHGISRLRRWLEARRWNDSGARCCRTVAAVRALDAVDVCSHRSASLQR